MIGIICRNDRLEEIRKGVSSQIVFERSGEFNSDEISNHLGAAATVPISILIIDLDSVTHAEGSVVKGLRGFRMNRPKARVILLGIGRKPGDITVSALVRIGVYDVIAPPEDNEFINVTQLISDQIQKNTTYADVARWDYDFESDETPRASKQQIGQKDTIIKEQIKFRDRIVGTPIVAVAGTRGGSGCTHNAIQIALTLRQYAKNIVCVEVGNEEISKRSSIATLMEVSQRHEPEIMYHAAGVDFSYTTNPLTVISKKEFDYIVLDIGEMFYERNGQKVVNPHIGELTRASIGVLSSTGSPWGCDSLIRNLKEYELYRSNWSVLTNLTGNETYKKLNEYFNYYETNAKFHLFQIPYHPEPFQLDKDNKAVWEHILSPILPSRSEGRGFLPKMTLPKISIPNIPFLKK